MEEQRLFRFSPKTGAHVGRHVLLVRGRDASGKTETADFTLHVSATNDAPEAEVSMDGFSARRSGGTSSSGWSFGRGWSSVFVELASLSLVRELGARGAIFVVFDFRSGGCVVSGRERTGRQIPSRCFFLHGLRRNTGACICTKQ